MRACGTLLGALFLVTLVLGVPTARAALPRCRDLASADALAHGAEVAPHTQEPPASLLRATAWFLLRGYQRLISPADGAGCTMYPSCSRYAMEAVRDEGPLFGLFLTTSRLDRDHDDDVFPLCVAGTRVFRYDPPRWEVDP